MQIIELRIDFQDFISLKISSSSSRFQIPLGILNDLCWIPVGIRPLRQNTQEKADLQKTKVNSTKITKVRANRNKLRTGKERRP